MFFYVTRMISLSERFLFFVSNWDWTLPLLYNRAVCNPTRNAPLWGCTHSIWGGMQPLVTVPRLIGFI
jgi:hypothetical protein